jgi:hypothetical protein
MKAIRAGQLPRDWTCRSRSCSRDGKCRRPSCCSPRERWSRPRELAPPRGPRPPPPGAASCRAGLIPAGSGLSAAPGRIPRSARPPRHPACCSRAGRPAGRAAGTAGPAAWATGIAGPAAGTASRTAAAAPLQTRPRASWPPRQSRGGKRARPAEAAAGRWLSQAAAGGRRSRAPQRQRPPISLLLPLPPPQQGSSSWAPAEAAPPLLQAGARRAARALRSRLGCKGCPAAGDPAAPPGGGATLSCTLAP